MSGQRSASAAGYVSLAVGQPFNPFRVFNGIFIPEALVRSKELSAGAKITYGRLTRYAGENGECYPAVPRLAAEIGMGERQTQRYLAELERKKFIRRLPRVLGHGQTSNAYVFLWHPILASAATKLSPEGVTSPSPKENQSEESQFEETTTNKRIPGDASQKPRTAASSSVTCKQQPESEPPKADAEEPVSSDRNRPTVAPTLKGWTQEELARVRHRIVAFFGREPEQGFEVSVMLRARGASAAAVCDLLGQKFADRKLRVGGRNAPRSQNWFLAVIENEFTPGHLPEPPSPVGPDKQRCDEEILNRGIEAIELPDAPRSIVESVVCSDCGGAALVRYTDGAVEGCSCRQRVTGSLKRLPPNGAEGCHSSSATRRGSASK